jgi:mono/diheme cytochrome c family protein
VPGVSTLLLAVGVLFSQTNPTTRSVWDGVYTGDQTKRGQPLYQQHCASCHGEKLAGGEDAPDLSGGAFLASWNGATANDLFEKIRVSMPQNRPGTLSRQNNADILSYIFSVNQFPAGKTELASEAGQLKQIRFEAAKPAEKK